VWQIVEPAARLFNTQYPTAKLTFSHAQQALCIKLQPVQGRPDCLQCAAVVPAPQRRWS
jgi:hypothetical protein